MPNPDLFPLGALIEAAQWFAAASRASGLHWFAVLTVLVCVLVGIGAAWRARQPGD